MKTVKKDPPDWMKVLYDYALGLSTHGILGKNPINELTTQHLKKEGVIPSNANAFIKFAMGDTEGLTEKDFSDEDMAFIRSLIQTAESEGRNDVQYYDYPSGEIPDDIDKLSPEGRVMTTLGRFTFEKGDDGNYVVSDSYDFNSSPELINWHAKILGITGEEYIDKYKYDPIGLSFDLKRRGIKVDTPTYRMLRTAYAPILNESRDPMPVKVNVTK